MSGMGPCGRSDRMSDHIVASCRMALYNLESDPRKMCAGCTQKSFPEVSSRMDNEVRHPET